MENYICKDQDGNLLLSVEQMSEAELSKDPLFTHCLAVVKVGNEYLLGRNKWRNRYEIFGGCAEKEETARECIVRECGEELGFTADGIISQRKNGLSWAGSTESHCLIRISATCTARSETGMKSQGWPCIAG